VRTRVRTTIEEFAALAQEVDLDQLQQRSHSFRAFVEFLRAPAIRRSDNEIDQHDPMSPGSG
jgi:hypothetical protein